MYMQGNRIKLSVETTINVHIIDSTRRPKRNLNGVLRRLGRNRRNHGGPKTKNTLLYFDRGVLLFRPFLVVLARNEYHE